MSAVNFGDWMRNIRVNRKMTQRELSARSGVSQQSVCSIEVGRMKPSVPVADAICKALNATYTLG